ncbi:class I SAM-dependent methyltransferase [Litoreibacter sp.]|nr:class I SAM-dependent methyltransferase [Litoreibacter sp.]
MTNDAKFDTWSAGQSYEHYMGRWSRKVAAKYINWLDAPSKSDWLEIGCGSGALTQTILANASPHSIMAIDASDDFVAHARAATTDDRLTFQTANAQVLPFEDASYDIVTSALVLNFVPDKIAALTEMQRVLRPGGTVSFYVWDYPGGGIGFIDAFWHAAAEVDPNAAELNEGSRFPFCTGAGLTDICAQAGLSPSVTPLEITTRFKDFEDFWMPFTLGAGPAPGYCMSLPDDHRDALKAKLMERTGGTSPIDMTARAWAVKSEVHA